MFKPQLGSRLVQNGIISERQLQEALEEQRSNTSGHSEMLGEILVHMGACTEEDIARAMSQNTGYDLISLNSNPIDMAAANLITPEMAQRYNAIPIGMENDRLLVAMQNPNDLLAIDDLHLITGHEIQPVVVMDDELKAVLAQFSNMSVAVEAVDEEEEEETETLTDEGEGDKPAVILASQVINGAIRAGASDVHVEPQEHLLRIRYRIDGVLHEVMQQPASMHAPLVSRIKVMANMDIAERRVPQDGRATVKVDGKIIDIRVASLPSAYGEKITMRLLNRSSQMITIEQLGFPSGSREKYLETIAMPYGFLLVTGPTGSGKSTTLYASLALLNSPDKNVITLEDPIERRMDGLNQVQMNAKAGMTFASGLRSILRSDPDVIMVGEIRDQETAKIAVESALTGHFVLSTLHTNDAASAVTRLAEMGVENFLTASSLVGVVAQRLVRVLCPKCREAYKVRKHELLSLVPDFPWEEGQEEMTLYRAKGCVSCNNTGYAGRRGVYEFLPVTEEIQKLILSRASNHEIKDTAVRQGMITLRADGLNKVKEGVTSIEEMLRVIV